MVHSTADPCPARAVCAAEIILFRLDPVSDDPYPANAANGGEFLNSALKAIESMRGTGCRDLERQVIIISANFTNRHRAYSYCILDWIAFIASRCLRSTGSVFAAKPLACWSASSSA